jgi:O-antigen/teichoic acid export membrane protein
VLSPGVRNVSDSNSVFGGEAPSMEVVGARQPNRVRRLFQGWSANLLQILLGVTQQVALVPVFLHFWSGETFAAWLSIYAAGNLILIADCGLHVRAINKFLALRARPNCDERTADFFGGLLRIYLTVIVSLGVLLLLALFVIPPSASLGFAAIPDFDLAFGLMILGILPTITLNAATALYRARGYYGRAVRLQCVGMLLAQLGQLAAIVITADLLAVTMAYVIALLLLSAYVVLIDLPRLFPFIRRGNGARSPRWMIGELGKAFPFAIASTTELALAYAPVLLVSAFVSDRLAVAQWGLTRVVASLLRALCTQTTLPLAAELGHDYATGETKKLRDLYAGGSVLVTGLASIVVSGLLAFWPDFFGIWTHGVVPYDRPLTLTLLIGTAVVAPSILAANYASYSNRGKLLALSKSSQLVMFLILSFILVPWLGPLGVAFAIVSSDLLLQIGWLTTEILRLTLAQPFRHILFLMVLVVGTTLGGWALGSLIRGTVPGAGLAHFLVECALWLLVVAVTASPLLSQSVRHRLAAAIPG